VVTAQKYCQVKEKQVLDKDVAKSKKESLVMNLKEFPSLLVAFSGGVDSSFLLAIARQVLGEKVLAATASSIIHPFREKEAAVEFTKQWGIGHIIFESNETGIPEFVSNSPERCYHCKKSLSQRLISIAKEKGMEYVAYATNHDDLKDYRPGTRAAVETGILSPLIDAKLGKDEIRFLSKEMGLASWDKPAMACLASRIPYGDYITSKKLKMVEEAENFLFENGFRQFRVRLHAPVARIEVPLSETGKLIEEKLRVKILEKFREIGFMHVSVDLEGYVSGSMNRELLMEDINGS
jgi:uncharacterized protein